MTPVHNGQSWVYICGVQRFCVRGDAIGAPFNLVVDDGRVSVVDSVPRDCYVYCGTPTQGELCMDTLFKLEHVKVDVAPPEHFARCMRAVADANVVIPWCDVMPSHAFSTHVKNVVKGLAVAFERTARNYYEGTWVPGGSILGMLVPARVDKHAWLQLMRSEDNSTNRSTLETFEPDAEGFARLAVYDRLKTRTGRLSMRHGPNILTLKRDHRKILRSRYGDAGCVVYVDFAALEARVILHESGRWFNTVDMYTHLAEEVFGGRFNRHVVKGAIISEMYGISSKRLAETLGTTPEETQEFIGTVRTYFNIDSLLQRVRREFASEGYVRNRYGRRVRVDEPSDHMLVNSYVQSTGVDVSMLGFSALAQRLTTEAPGTKPIFLLHDAMFLDVPLDELPRVKAIDSVHVPGYVQRFFLHVEEL